MSTQEKISRYFKVIEDTKKRKRDDEDSTDFVPYDNKKVKKLDDKQPSSRKKATSAKKATTRKSPAVDNPSDTKLVVEKVSPNKSPKKDQLDTMVVEEPKVEESKPLKKEEEKKTARKSPTKEKKASPPKKSIPPKREIRTLDLVSTSIGEHIEVPKVSSIWSDKYSPKNSSELVANPGAIKDLKSWLANWTWDTSKNKLIKKVCLLSGPPGIGKTSAALVVAKEAGYRTIHLNASDQRSKTSLQSNVSTMLRNRGLNEFSNENQGKTLLIMDEVDGMSSGDRGGLAEFNQMIKTTKIPIICICNDKYKVRTLASSPHVLHLPFRRPTVAQMANRFKKILADEKISMDSESLNKVIASTNGDVRQVFHTLQFMHAGSDKLVGGNIDKYLKNTNKDFDLGPYDVAPRLLSCSPNSTKSINERLEYFFVDYSLMPLFVQENYLRIQPTETMKGMKKDVSDIMKFAEAADAISESDIISSTIYSDQNFELLPVFGVMSSIRPTSILSGSIGHRIEFPSYLGKLSTTNKRKRLLNEVKYEVYSTSNGMSSKSLALDGLKYMYEKIVDPLVENGKDGIDAVVDFMQVYNLTGNGRDNILELCEYGLDKKKPKSSLIDTQTKRAFTRKLNQTIVPAFSRSNTKTKNDESEEAEEEEDNPLKDPSIKPKIVKSKSDVTKKPKKTSSKRSTSNIT